MIKVAGMIPKDSPYAKYELVILVKEDTGKISFHSEFHFNRVALKNIEDVAREIQSNVINVIVVEHGNSLQLSNMNEIQIHRKSVVDCYLDLGFIHRKEQLQKERDLWRIQIQDQLKRFIRGIDGPCERLYSSEQLDALILALHTIKNF